MNQAPKIAEFDATAPIEAGVTLIEASAGTGKTYGITSLALRLVAEAGLSVESILVVTYTRAATAELRDRIRARLVAAHAHGLQLTSGPREIGSGSCGDRVIDYVFAQPEDWELRVARIAAALVEFERAAIFTIHGFCQHVLTRFGFEGGVSPQLEVGESQDAILREIVGDAMAASASACRDAAAWASFVSAQGMSQGALMELARGPGSDPAMELIPRAATPEKGRGGSHPLYEHWVQTLDDYAAHWPKRRELLVDELLSLGSSGLVSGTQGPFHAKKDGAPRSTLVKLLADFDALVSSRITAVASENDGGDSAERVAEVGARAAAAWSQCKLQTALLKALIDPDSLRQRREMGLEIRLLDDLVSLAIDVLAIARVEFVQYVRRELPRRTRARRMLSFHDLLTLVHERVTGGLKSDQASNADSINAAEADTPFAEQIRSLYHAALIDEFQDTDAIQWELFARLFHRPDRRLILIGDPKQAIYGFRGADVEVYGVAKSATPVERRRSMETNYRSDQRYLTVINQLFALSEDDNVFEVEGISAPAVYAPPRSPEQTTMLCSRGRPVAPLVLRWVDDHAPAAKAARPQVRPKKGGRARYLSSDARLPRRRENTGGGSAAESSLAVAQMVALDIAVLLARRLELGVPAKASVHLLHGAERTQLGSVAGAARPLRAGDIAVLVSTNAQALQISDALHRVGLRAVVPRAGSVFAGEEAEWLRTWLAYLCAPERESRARSLALTPLGGWDAARIVASRAQRASGEVGSDPWYEWLRVVGEGNHVIARRGVQVALHALLSATEAGPRLAAQWRGERTLTNLRHLGELLHRAQRSLGASAPGLYRWLTQQIEAPGDTDADDEQRLESDENAISITTIHKSKGLEYPVTFLPSLWMPRSERRAPAFVAFREPAGCGPDHDAPAPDLAPIHEGPWPQQESVAQELQSPTRIADVRPSSAARGRDRHVELAAEANFQENLRLAYVALTRARHCTYLYECPMSRAQTRSLDGETETSEEAGTTEAGEGRTQWRARSSLSSILLGGLDIAKRFGLQGRSRGSRTLRVAQYLLGERAVGRGEVCRAYAQLFAALSERHPNRVDGLGAQSSPSLSVGGPSATGAASRRLIGWEARGPDQLSTYLRRATHRAERLRSATEASTGGSLRPTGVEHGEALQLRASTWTRGPLRDAWTRTSYSTLLRGLEASRLVSVEGSRVAPADSPTLHVLSNAGRDSEISADGRADFSLREDEDRFDHDLRRVSGHGRNSVEQVPGAGVSGRREIATSSGVRPRSFDAERADLEAGDGWDDPGKNSEAAVWGSEHVEFNSSGRFDASAVMYALDEFHDLAVEDAEAIHDWALPLVGSEYLATEVADVDLGDPALNEVERDRALEGGLAAGDTSDRSWLSEECLMSRVGAGTLFGTLVHAVLEDLDFAALRSKSDASSHGPSGLSTGLSTVLDAGGLRGAHPQPQGAPVPSTSGILERITHYAGRLGARVQDPALLAHGLVQALETPLGSKAGGITLRQLSLGDRLDELSFDLSIAGGDQWRGGASSASVAELLDIVAGVHDTTPVPASRTTGHGARALGSVADELAGFLCGEIDMVYRVWTQERWRYFVCDYKTNWLGSRAHNVHGERVSRSAYDNYGHEALRDTIHAHRYDLQYHLYLLALHRYLRSRDWSYDYDQDVGGVVYLFLRGMAGNRATPTEGDPTGVFFDRPPRARIEALDAWISGGAVHDAGFGNLRGPA